MNLSKELTVFLFHHQRNDFLVEFLELLGPKNLSFLERQVNDKF